MKSLISKKKVLLTNFRMSNNEFGEFEPKFDYVDAYTADDVHQAIEGFFKDYNTIPIIELRAKWFGAIGDTT